MLAIQSFNQPKISEYLIFSYFIRRVSRKAMGNNWGKSAYVFEVRVN